MNSVICQREGCQIASTSRCVEGFDPANSCPYFSIAHGESEGAGAADQNVFVNLPSGEALLEEEASEVTREGVTKVIVLAGPVGGGKTTILTSLFEAFLEAPFGNFLFAGSRTLVGFERRCHDARETSGRSNAETLRTPIVNVVQFLHLRLTSTGRTLLRLQNLLLSDISGERFRALRDSSSAVDEMKVLRRADHLCIVVDGESLADPNQRNSARNETRLLLRSLLQRNSISSNCQIEVVFTKWDLVLSYSDQKSLMLFIEETKSVLEQAVDKFAKLRFFEIAARPTTKRLPFAHGLPTLLRSWLEDPVAPLKPKLYVPTVKNRAREISRFSESIAEVQHLGDFYDVRRV